MKIFQQNNFLTLYVIVYTFTSKQNTKNTLIKKNRLAGLFIKQIHTWAESFHAKIDKMTWSIMQFKCCLSVCRDWKTSNEMSKRNEKFKFYIYWFDAEHLPTPRGRGKGMLNRKRFLSRLINIFNSFIK